MALQELLSQATWNLCPVSGVPSGIACYYSEDQTFTQLTGNQKIVISDCPDGERAPLIYGPHPRQQCVTLFAANKYRIRCSTPTIKVEEVK